MFAILKVEVHNLCTNLFNRLSGPLPLHLVSVDPIPRSFNFIVQLFGLLKRSALFNQFLLDLQFQVDDISPAGTEGAVSLGLSDRGGGRGSPSEGSAPECSS